MSDEPKFNAETQRRINQWVFDTYGGCLEQARAAGILPPPPAELAEGSGQAEAAASDENLPQSKPEGQVTSSLSDSRLQRLAAMPTNDRIGHMTKQEHDDLIEEVIWRRRQFQEAGRMALLNAAHPMVTVGSVLGHGDRAAVFERLVEALTAIEDGEGDADVIARQTLASIPNAFRTDAE
ncbi:MAG: hypothetical protein EOO12_00020 [Chitinophagaceae bacterium]|nr:MAG: hypothetical protein EOO12_00020 [Chitinophagaceae bacterium]